MKNFLTIIAGTTLTMSLSACATTPDPVEVCTAEWVKPRAERAVDRIADKTKPAIRSLRKVGESWAKGKEPSILKMMSMQSSVKKLMNELEDGKGINDLRTLANTCDDPKIITTAMSDFLSNQGFSDKIIGFIESMGFYERALETMSTPETT